MPEGNTDIALGRRVGQVTLHTRGDQRRCQGIEQCARDFQVRFGIFEANRVHLVRHSRRTGGALRCEVLVEVAHRNVGPAVGCQVVCDTSCARNVGVELCLPVVRFDLRGQRIPGQAQAFDEVASDDRPISVRDGNDVCCPSSRGAVDLAQVFGVFDACQLTSETVCKHGHFLAHGDGRCGLTVRVCQHRSICAGLSKAQQSSLQFAGGR
ncbi:Uncharacterised protein [Chlamydia trachomatis]|nr:Uncharacterised protein [Chlamydia trachomatis]